MRMIVSIMLLWLAAIPAATAAVILQYHHVSADTPSSTSVTPAEFKAQLQHLKDQKLKVVPLDRLIGQFATG